MSYEFKLPDLGEGLTEGEIARWLVEEGQEIAEDDPLVEIATDKTTVEIPSPAGGTVSRILVAEGEVVPVGTVLVQIGGDGAGPVPVSDTETRPKGTYVDTLAMTGAWPARDYGLKWTCLGNRYPDRSETVSRARGGRRRSRSCRGRAAG